MWMEMSSQSLSNISVLFPVAPVPPDSRRIYTAVPPTHSLGTFSPSSPFCPSSQHRARRSLPRERPSSPPPQPTVIPGHTLSRAHVDRGSVYPAATRSQQRGRRSFAAPAAHAGERQPGCCHRCRARRDSPFTALLRITFSVTWTVREEKQAHG